MLTWTDKPPQEPGWYLAFTKSSLHNGGNLLMCHYIFKWHDRLYVGASPMDRHGYEWVVTLRQYEKWYPDALWAGPLEEPSDAD